MWISNRKHGYKVIRYIKRRKVYVLQGEFCEFRTSEDNLDKCGYRQVKSKPVTARR